MQIDDRCAKLKVQPPALKQQEENKKPQKKKQEKEPTAVESNCTVHELRKEEPFIVTNERMAGFI